MGDVIPSFSCANVCLLVGLEHTLKSPKLAAVAEPDQRIKGAAFVIGVLNQCQNYYLSNGIFA